MAEKNKLFTAEVNMSLIAQYVRVYLANQRQGNASAKNRGEVSGGGKKPWRQKGTGRARHGSIRSPIWVGGGVAHAPKPRNWDLKMPSKMRRKALFSALSLLENEGRVLSVNLPLFEKVSTKKMSEFLSENKVLKPALLVLPDFKEPKLKKVFLSSRNLEKVSIQRAQDINAYSVLKAKTVVFLNKAEIGITQDLKKLTSREIVGTPTFREKAKKNKI